MANKINNKDLNKVSGGNSSKEEYHVFYDTYGERMNYLSRIEGDDYDSISTAEKNGKNKAENMFLKSPTVYFVKMYIKFKYADAVLKTIDISFSDIGD